MIKIDSDVDHWVVTFKYDINKLPIFMEEHLIPEDPEVIKCYQEFTYSDNGQITKTKLKDLYDLHDIDSTIYLYDENGVLRSSLDDNDYNDYSSKYIYDEKNRIVTVNYESKWVKHTTSYEYDEQNRIIKETNTYDTYVLTYYYNY